MGISNLAMGLVRKFGSWSGERIALESEIAKINEAYATIDEKRARVERLSILINASKEIMAELDPEWKPESVRPSPPRQQKLPYEPGLVTRWAMDIIRGTTGSFSSRELAERIVSDQHGDMDDLELINRVKEAVDASLRKKAGVYVRYTDMRPTRWERIDLDEPQG